MTYQSPSRHSFPSTQRYFLDKKPQSGLKEIRRVGLMNLLENPQTSFPPRLIGRRKSKRRRNTPLPKNLSPRYASPQTHPRHQHLHSHESCSRLPQYQTHGGTKSRCLQNISQREILSYTFRSGCRGFCRSRWRSMGRWCRRLLW